MRSALSSRVARARSDEGSALILALLVVLVGSLLLGVSLDFARGGLTVAPKARELRNETTYLQGAADAAINNIRNSTAYGRTTGPACPTYSAPGAATDLQGAAGKAFSVTCTPQTVTGAGAIDQPDFAIHTLGQDPGEGVNQINNGHTLVVEGGIYSRGVIAGGTGPKDGIEVHGSVYAEGTCVGVTTTDTTGLHCGYAGPSGTDTFGSDPKYAAAISTDTDLTTLIGADSGVQAALGADPVPTCTSFKSPTIEFYEGYYSETPEALADGVSTAPDGRTCQGDTNGTTYHFNPGRYYFNYGRAWNPSASKKLKLLGGTLTAGYTGGGALGGACNTAQSGVQLIFGGATQIVVNNKTQWEMCGPTTGNPQHIVFYGLSSNANNNAAASAPAAVTTTLAATVAPTTGTGQAAMTNPANAQVIDVTSTATYIPLDSHKVGTLAYSSLAKLPKGARVSSVKVVVAQTLVSAKSTITLKSPKLPDISRPCEAACTVDVTSDFLGHGPAWRHVNGVSIDYVVETSNAAGTAAVDGLALAVTYSMPALVQLSCPGGGCKTFDSSDNNAVFFHGTVYAPSAAMAVEVFNSSLNLFDRGVVARTLDVVVGSSSKQTTSPFQIPAATPQGRLVLFRGYVDGVEKLRTCVAYTDKTSDLALAGYRLAVKRWSVFTTASGTPTCT